MAPGLLLGGRYRLSWELARGGMAAVWEAEDKVLARRVAVKVLHAHLAGDDAFRARFRREAVAAARLAHPNIVTTFDTGSDGDVAYIVMELVDGTTVARLLRSDGPLPVARAAEIAAGVADALAAAHARGVVHRDVKPANILLRADGRVKVADFGIAKAGVGADLTRTGMVLGTAKYLSPEQVRGNPADASSDIYALGIVLYEMLCGVPPFVGANDLSTAVARLKEAPESLRARRIEVPPDLEAVVLRSLAADPEDRFRSAADLRDGLLAIHGDDDTTPAAGLASWAVRPAPEARQRPPAAPARHRPARPGADMARGPGRRRTRRALAVVGVAVVVLGVRAVGRHLGGSGRPHTGTSPATGLAAPAGGVVASGAVRGYPAAVLDLRPGSDEVGNPAVAHVSDGDPSTTWKSEAYDQNFPSKYKTGLGVYLDLGRTATVRHVSVATVSPGWTAQIYVAASPAPALAGWGPVRAGGPGPSFDVARASGRYVLVWFTSLAPVTTGSPPVTRYQVEVREITVDAR